MLAVVGRSGGPAAGGHGFGAGGAGTGPVVEIGAPQPLPALVAVQLGGGALPAGVVDGHHRLAAPPRHPAVPPLAEGGEDAPQVPALGGEDVVVAGRVLGVEPALPHVVVDQALQTRGEER